MALVIRQLSRAVRRTTPSLSKFLKRPQTRPDIQLCYFENTKVYQTSTSFFHTTNTRLSNVINIQDEEDFKNRVIESSIPVVVDFHADWCGPCKLLGPRLETLVGSKNNEEQKVVLAKVDIDEIPDIAMEYGVEAIPTVVSVKNGKVMDKFVGLKEDDEIETFLVKLVG